MKKSMKIGLIIIAAAIVLGIAGFIVIKDIINKNREPEYANITLFKCYMGKEINDTDLKDIKEIANSVTDNKVIDIEKGAIAGTQLEFDENDEIIYNDYGDSVTITFIVLDDEEKSKVFTALANEYGLNGNHLLEIKDINRADGDQK